MRLTLDLEYDVIVVIIVTPIVLKYEQLNSYRFAMDSKGRDDEEEHERDGELHEERLHGANRRHGGDGGAEVRRIIDHLDGEGGGRGAKELGSHVWQDRKSVV